MCTSLTYENSRGDQFLARTMDFAFELGGQPIFMPRNQTIKGDAGEFSTKYGFIGAGRNLSHYMFVDGVNEFGLGAAALYFPEYVAYQKVAPTDKLGLAPHDVTAWALGNAKSVADLRELVKTIQILDVPVALLGITTPLHFIFSDSTGDTAVLEATSADLQLIDDPVGVMANAPQLSWHLQNLSTYGTMQAAERPLHDYEGLELKTQGPGTRALGLPGDYTSPSRFVRTVYNKHYSIKTDNTPDTLNLLQHLLDSVTIPKGVKLKADGKSDYTQYRGYANLSERTYYMEPYDNLELQGVKLTDKMLTEWDTPVEYPLDHTPHIKALN
ncbi:choloylglycine hydrolase family protein [Levilactobacillus cerevisiae]|uniref:choloylglycine hydrolase family protein n=1 Tax=Levilactobacillus cerevisiae TaxID=1704076 RepID=UPI00345E59B0